MTAAVALLLLLLAGVAEAHPLAPGLLEVRVAADHSATVVWKTPLLQPSGANLNPELPAGCRPVGASALEAEGAGIIQRWQVVCDGSWLGATVGMRGLAASKTSALARIVLADGSVQTALLTAERPSFQVAARAGRSAVARQYVGLGVSHLLTGLDHLLFVLGLVLLLEGWRARLATVTAFTVGHSVTLALAVLGLVRFPVAPIEAAIAASIVLLAAELASARRGTAGVLSRRPWTMALAFGLLHGFGFAGALAAIGLPIDEIPLALFSFNVGIELGQLAFVAVVVMLLAAGRAAPWPQPRWLAAAPAYGIGGIAAYWCIERLEPIVRGMLRI